MKRVLLACLAVLLAATLVVTSAGPVAAEPPPATATFVGLGQYSSIHSRYHSGNVIAGVIKMQVGSTQYDSHCIDLYHSISIGNTLLVNGPLSDDIRADVNWCAVNYILYNYSYLTPPSGFTQAQEAAAIQAAIWYFVTEPYGPYTGVSGQKYQFMSDPLTPIKYDAYYTAADPSRIRDRAFVIINSVPPDVCTSFHFPDDVTLDPESEDVCGNLDLTVTVYDQNGQPMPGVQVVFETDKGTVAPPSGTTDSNGQCGTTLDGLDDGDTATVWAYAQGPYGTLLYDQNYQKQEISTIALLPRSVGDYSTVRCEAAPSIHLGKYVSRDGIIWYSAQEAPGLLVPAGSQVYFKFVVTNTGNVPLGDVTLNDNVFDADLGPCRGTIPNPLPSGDSVECIIGPYTVTPTHANAASTTGSYGGETYGNSSESHYTATYVKSGTVFIDADGDKNPDPGEGVVGITVFLCQDCPVDEAAPSTTLGTAVTDPFGHYEFTGVPPGEYVVSIPRETDAANDRNEWLYEHYNVIQTDKVKYNPELKRACIRFTLTGYEFGNDFGFAPKVAKIPAISGWGTIALAMLLGVTLLVVVLRKRLHLGRH